VKESPLSQIFGRSTAELRALALAAVQRKRQEKRSEEAPERFAASVGSSDAKGCRLWTGNVHVNGYGRFGINDKAHYAHRWAYEQTWGPIPDGRELHHTCGNRRCVSVEHLEALTPAEHRRVHAEQSRKCEP
jgi:hypothetical protein